MYVRGELIAQGAAGQLTGFAFDLYGYQEAWHVTVDSLVVTP